MNTYFITAYDHVKEGSLEKRMSVRPDHLEGLRKLKANGNIVTAGAILNENGTMIGSAMVLQFESDEEMDAWKVNEPYFAQGVWASIDVKPFRIAAL